MGLCVMGDTQRLLVSLIIDLLDYAKKNLKIAWEICKKISAVSHKVDYQYSIKRRHC